MKRLSFIDRLLTLWIILAMGLGLALGAFFPKIPQFIDSLAVGQTNAPLAICLILMMYPPLARVRFGELREVFQNARVLGLSVLLNWIVGPLLMFGLAVLFLWDRPELMAGLVMIGLARCIAMVLVWNQLAEGSPEYAAGLVALNSIFQVFAYAPLAVLFLTVIPGWLGLASFDLEISTMDVAPGVLIYLGIPFLAGLLSRFILGRWKGQDWYEKTYIPAIAPITLCALLVTIVLMFSLKGEMILSLPTDVLRVSIPLLLYFLLMFSAAFLAGLLLKENYPENAAVSFTAAGNNFELAIAVSIAVFGLHSGQAFAAVIGPLIEVPALILLVGVALRLRRRLYGSPSKDPSAQKAMG